MVAAAVSAPAALASPGSVGADRAVSGSAAPRVAPAPGAHSAVVATFAAKWVIEKLLGGAASHLGSTGMGWVLAQWGIGDGLGPQLGELRSALSGIDNRLSALEKQTEGLRGELAQSHYSNLINQSLPIITKINEGTRDVRFQASLKASDTTKANLARHRLTFIERDLLTGHQEELALRISGHLGADGLIVAASKQVKADTRFWTSLTSQQVEQVLSYYQQEEAALLELRNEYWHAYPDTFNAAYIEGKDKQVLDYVNSEDKLLKPHPASEIFADTTGDLEWWWGGVVTPTGALDFNRTVKPPGGFLGGGWRLPTSDELRHLIKGWKHHQGWISWLNEQLDGQLPLSGHSFAGVWTNDTANTRLYCPGGYSATRVVRGYLAADGQFLGSEAYNPCPERHGTARYGVLLVRTRTHHYWWQ
ncbi:hypothetical protein AYO39_01330 [Actinobacteria bacterium SCGC AG-212-D09]|nr:hypothetical protein AYO39_01330 [Actinobacteria bacterium SCGC AG-212-D09]